MFVIYGYKEGDSEAFGDGDEAAFGPYESESDAEDDRALMSEDEWQSRVLQVQPLSPFINT